MIVPRFYFYDDFTQFRDVIVRNGAQKKSVPKGTTLWEASQAERTMYYVEEGLAKVVMLNEDGNENIMFFIGPGCIWSINLLEDAFSMEKYLHMIAVTDLKVRAFSQNQMKNMIKECKEFSFELVNHYCRQSNLLLAKLYIHSGNDSLKYVATFLYLYLKFKPNDENLIDLKQKDIAGVVGISQSTLTRMLTKLRDDGIIETAKGKIRIINVEALYELCNELAKDKE